MAPPGEPSAAAAAVLGAEGDVATTDATPAANSRRRRSMSWARGEPLLSHSSIYIKLAATPNDEDSTYILGEFNLQTVTMKYTRMQQPEGMKPT